MKCPLRKVQLVSSIDDFQLHQGELQRVLLSYIVDRSEKRILHAVKGKQANIIKAAMDSGALLQSQDFLAKTSPQASAACC